MKPLFKKALTYVVIIAIALVCALNYQTIGISTSLSYLAVYQPHRTRYFEKRAQDRQPDSRL